MQSKIFVKRILLVIGVISGFLFFIALYGYVTPKNSINDGSVVLAKNNIAVLDSPMGRPIRLKIPSINVDAHVEQVGLTSDGLMDVPKGRDNVAWFNLGSRPGENGSAAIAGHYGWKGGKPLVFNDLHTLRMGDKLYVEDEKGKTTSFVVRRSQRYDPKADASAVFGSSDNRAHLNLITCEGVLDKVTQTYSQRLVVFTDNEE